MGLIPIQTDASYFFENVKSHFVASGKLCSDEIYQEAIDLRELVGEEHERLCEELPSQKFPLMIYSLAYQDGLMHAFDRVVTHRNTGEYSHPCKLRTVASAYESLQKQKRSAGIYEDVAYIEGYVNAFIYLGIFDEWRREGELNDGDEMFSHPPLYFAFGLSKERSGRGELGTYEDLEELIPALPAMHKSAFKRARRIAESVGEGLTFHHPPWL